MLDPLATTEKIGATYTRYLRSTLNPRDQELHDEFSELLESPENRLTKGPIIQAVPPYVRGKSIQDLVQAGALHPDLGRLPSEVFPPDRPLYRHQVRAIERVTSGRNALVATGTGSGKTESFLFPVLDHLLRERDAGTLDKPGIRALFLYPMNALANDQLKRLRELLTCFPDITFGQYIGDTKQEQDRAIDSYRNLFQSNPEPNELISREAMNESPPHILITNFSMLEYLLLRPADSAFFDGATGEHWKFLVLDEVHVYDGSKGTEIAYLLRRLRDRVVKSEQGRLTCIGTSATLGSGEGDKPRLVEFSTSLFDESFDIDDLIDPEREPIDGLIPAWTATQSGISQIWEVLNQKHELAELISTLESAGWTEPRTASTSQEILGLALETESTIIEVRSALAGSAQDLATVASVVGIELEDLLRIIELGWRAVDRNGVPLIPARYHTFIRSLEGAYVCACPSHIGPRLSLTRHRFCQSCLASGHERKLFEFGTCRRCGSSYLLGNEEIEHGACHLVPANLVERNLVNLLWEPKGSLDDESDTDLTDEDEQIKGEEANDHSRDSRWLCTCCGDLSEIESASGCCIDTSRIQVRRLTPGKGGVSRVCVACSGRSKSNIVFRYLTGADAAGAVIASTLYQSLPADPNAASEASADGRKLLTFADSRQDAAYFAPFLERTYSKSVERRLLWETLQKIFETDVSAHPRFEGVCTRLVARTRDEGCMPGGLGSSGELDEIRKRLTDEVLTVDANQSLEGIGLARIAPSFSDIEISEALIPSGMNATSTIDLVIALLATLKIRNCVTLPDGVDIKSDADGRFSPRNFQTSIRLSGPDGSVMAWIPKLGGHNARLDLVERVFERVESSSDARAWLELVWLWLTDSASPAAGVLVSLNDKRFGTVWRLNHDRLEFVIDGHGADARRCQTCRLTTWYDIEKVCTRYKCKGTTEAGGFDPDDHYRSLYLSIEAIPAVIDEHTAQLDSEEAARRQADFIRGKINILSCSTTFELGVDVGEIQSVLLRDVPPSPANYVQRAGRAGRRTGSPSLTVTLARQRNHDQHFFQNPLVMINGVVSPPVINILNPQIARRHVHSIAFSRFMREWVGGGKSDVRSIADFYGDGNETGPTVCDEFEAWLALEPDYLRDEITRVLPTEIASELGVATWAWSQALISPPVVGSDDHGRLWFAKENYFTVRSEMNDRVKSLVDDGSYGPAQSVENMLKTIKNERLLNHLARRTVLPKYGFPVDTVSLDLRRAANSSARHLELDRDLAIAIVEYAPGSQVVADKNLWQSVGLTVPAGLDLQEFFWWECSNCHAVSTQHVPLGEITFCSVCRAEERSAGGKFVWPQFGFVGKWVQKAGEQRPIRIGSAEAHFGRYTVAEEPVEVQICGQSVETISSRNGEIHLINHPAEVTFTWCKKCGAMEPVARNRRKSKRVSEWKHAVPGSDKQCASTFWNSFDLGHQYHTDVAEIRLGIGGSYFEYRSALQALLAALPEIGIQRTDVRGMLRKHKPELPPSLLLVDAVPGGAGHARRIIDDLERLLIAAARKARNCDCGEDSSCYSCLRSYENQRIHDEITRRRALTVLSRFE